GADALVSVRRLHCDQPAVGGLTGGPARRETPTSCRLPGGGRSLRVLRDHPFPTPRRTDRSAAKCSGDVYGIALRGGPVSDPLPLGGGIRTVGLAPGGAILPSQPSQQGRRRGRNGVGTDLTGVVSATGNVERTERSVVVWTVVRVTAPAAWSLQRFSP